MELTIDRKLDKARTTSSPRPIMDAAEAWLELAQRTSSAPSDLGAFKVGELGNYYFVEVPNKLTTGTAKSESLFATECQLWKSLDVSLHSAQLGRKGRSKAKRTRVRNPLNTDRPRKVFRYDSEWHTFDTSSRLAVIDGLLDGFGNPVGFTSSRSELGITLARLYELLEEEDEFPELAEEIGAIRPTPFAFNFANSLILGVVGLLANPFPRASVSTDYEGGIRVSWRRGEKEVRLICDSKSGRQNYIYRELHDDYNVVRPVDAASLAEALDWLTTSKK